MSRWRHGCGGRDAARCRHPGIGGRGGTPAPSTGSAAASCRRCEQGRKPAPCDHRWAARTPVGLERVQKGVLPLSRRPPRGDSASEVPPEVHLGDGDAQRADGHRVECELELVVPELSCFGGQSHPARARHVARHDVVANAGGGGSGRLRVDDDAIDGGRGLQGDCQRGGRVPVGRCPSLSVPDREPGDGSGGVSAGGRGGGAGSGSSQVRAVVLRRAHGQRVLGRIGQIRHVTRQGQAVCRSRRRLHGRGPPELVRRGDRSGGAPGIGQGDGPRHRQAIGPYRGHMVRAAGRGAEVSLVRLRDTRCRHRQVGPAGQHTGRGHGGERSRLHVVHAVRGLDQRKADPVVPPRPLVEEVALDRDAQHLLPDQGSCDVVGLAEEVDVSVAPPADLGEPQRLSPEEGLQLTHLGLHPFFFVGTVRPCVRMDGGHIHVRQPTGGDQLLPPSRRWLESGAADHGRRRARKRRLDGSVEGGQDRCDIGAAVAPAGVVRLVPGLPRSDGRAVGTASRHLGVVGDQCSYVLLPPSTVDQGGGHGAAVADLHPVGDMILRPQERRLVRILAGVGEGHGRWSARRRSRGRSVALGEDGAPGGSGGAPKAAQSELCVQGHSPRIGRTAGPGARWQRRQGEVVPGSPHCVRHARGAERGRWRRAFVEEGGPHLVGPRHRVE